MSCHACLFDLQAFMLELPSDHHQLCLYACMESGCVQVILGLEALIFHVLSKRKLGHRTSPSSHINQKQFQIL